MREEKGIQAEVGGVREISKKNRNNVNEQVRPRDFLRIGDEKKEWITSKEAD